MNDSLQTLQNLATLHKKINNYKVIAITGSNGKTTTKELTYKILSQKNKVYCTKGNLNNHIGVPLSLLELKDEEIAIIEMGANHIGEIYNLCNIALPDYGLITNVGKAHLEGFGSIEGVIKAKTELYKFLNNNGTAFVKSENERLLGELKNFKGKIVQYGNSQKSICKGKIISSEFNLEMEIMNNNETIKIKSPLFGSYNFENILAAACIGIYFSVPLDNIKNGIENYIPDNQRSQLLNTKKNKIILDSYNANPTSMQEAITNFNNIKTSNKLLILGDMLELGNSTISEHKKIIKLIRSFNLKNTILVGEIFLKVINNNEFQLFSNTEKLIKYLKQHSIKNKTILIKGSRGIKLEKVIEYL